MPRRAPGGVRPLDPDPIHQSKLVQQVINKVMIDGKKSTAERIVYDALEQLPAGPRRSRSRRSRRRSRHLPPSWRCAPAASAAPPTRPGRGPPARARTLAVRWLITFSRARREKTMAERLAGDSGRAVRTGRRVQAQGGHLPHGAGQQGFRPLPLVAVAPPGPCKASRISGSIRVAIDRPVSAATAPCFPRNSSLFGS